MLARLWQLQNKMEALGGSAAGPMPGSSGSGGSAGALGGGGYEARIERVGRARANIEERLVGGWVGWVGWGVLVGEWGRCTGGGGAGCWLLWPTG